MLEVKKVTKRYPSQGRWFSGKNQGASALKDISLTLPAGQIGVLLGPNGAGKTTLIKLIANLLIPDTGQIYYNRRDIHRDAIKAAPEISFMAGEEKSFYWRLTGRQNLEFFAALYNIPSKVACQRIKDLARVFDFKNLDKMYQEYSTGYRQRLAMMRSLLSEANLVLMDEPTRSLDPLAAEHFRQLIKDQMKGNGRTVLLSTHNLEEALQIGDQIFILSEGYLKAAEPIGNIASRRQLSTLYEAKVSSNAFE